MNAPVAAKILSLNNVEVVYDYVSLAIGDSSTYLGSVGIVPPPPVESELPRSLLERAEAVLGVEGVATNVLLLVAHWLSPVTTQSVPDGSRFVSGALQS